MGIPGQGWDPGSRASALRYRASSSRPSVGAEPDAASAACPAFPSPFRGLTSKSSPSLWTPRPRPLSVVLSPAGPARSARPRHLDPSRPETLLTQASAPQTPPRPHPGFQKTSSALSACHVCPQPDLVLQLPSLTFALVQAVVGSHADKCRIVQHSGQADQWGFEVRVRRTQRFPQAESCSSVLTKVWKDSPLHAPPTTSSPHSLCPTSGHPTVPRCFCTARTLLFAEPLPGPRPPHLYSRGPPWPHRLHFRLPVPSPILGPGHFPLTWWPRWHWAQTSCWGPSCFPLGTYPVLSHSLLACSVVSALPPCKSVACLTLSPHQL